MTSSSALIRAPIFLSTHSMSLWDVLFGKQQRQTNSYVRAHVEEADRRNRKNGQDTKASARVAPPTGRGARLIKAMIAILILIDRW